MSDFFEDITDIAKKKELFDMVSEITMMKVAVDDIKAAYGVKDEDELLKKVKNGGAAEHPAYEAYLSILHIRDYIDHYRVEIQNFMDEI